MGTVSTTGGGVSYEATTAASIGAIPDAEKGAADGVAPLDAGGKVPPGQRVYAVYNLATQAADVTATTLYAVPADGAGMYRVSAYAVVTQAATTTSTLPNVQVLWTDADTSVALQASTVTSTNPANAPGAFGTGDIVVYAAASTNIQFQTGNYASDGATPMQFSVHLKLEYLG